ncbi:MAG: S49 family peptidase, partial [Geminicoccaceae bacterium]|nr:S49 family peptidase [Geminicoccaceae bacterium]
MTERAWVDRLPWRARPPVVPVIRLSGMIGGPAVRGRGLTLEGLNPILERAFKIRRLSALALSISSPGGSPVQSSLITERIRALAREREIPVLAFIEDVGASGGYWLALAGDEIFADGNSIVGSIGVISASFGLHDVIKRFGIERRVHTAGDKKSLMDPFRPEDPDDVARLNRLLGAIHQGFKDEVRSRRGERLKGADDDLFEGQIWTGRQAHEIGLIDGLGTLRTVLRERFGPKVRLPVMKPPRSWLRRRMGPDVH